MASFFDNFTHKDEKDLSFVESLSIPTRDIFSHFKDFIFLAGMVSIIVSLVTFFCGRSFFCGFGIGEFCSYGVVSFTLSIVVNLYAMAFFVNRWSLVVVQNESIKQILKEKCWKKDFKAVGIILLYVFLWGCIVFCSYVLKHRVATKDFVFELGFFVVFSSIIIFCLLLLLNFVSFYHYLQGGAFFTFHKTVGRICDNIYAILCTLMVYLMIFIFFIYQGGAFFRNYLQYGMIVQFLGEVYFYIIIYAGLAVFVSSFVYQEKKLFALK